MVVREGGGSLLTHSLSRCSHLRVLVSPLDSAEVVETQLGTEATTELILSICDRIARLPDEKGFEAISQGFLVLLEHGRLLLVVSVSLGQRLA